MKALLKCVGLLSLCGCLAGCATWDVGGDTAPTVSPMALELQALRGDVLRLQEAVAALEVRQQRLDESAELLRREQQAGSNAERARIDALEKTMRAAETERARMREEIVADISGKVAALVNARAASPYSGREHVVGRGEYLSQIAAKYGVSVKALQDANGITDPNTVRVGQKLKIP